MKIRKMKTLIEIGIIFASQKEYLVRFSTNSDGGYVENPYGVFEFNF